MDKEHIEVKHAYWTGLLSSDYAFAEGVPPNATEEQRQAYWDMFNHTTHCSNCKSGFDDRVVENYKVCPYCNSIMDGKQIKDSF